MKMLDGFYKFSLTHWFQSGLQDSRGFLGNVLILAGGTAASQVLTVAFIPVISRLYTPEMFGQFGVLLSLITLLQVPALLGFHRAIPVCRSDRAALNLIVLSLFCIFIVSGCTFVVTVFITLAWSKQSSVLTEMMWLFLPLGVFTTSFFELGTLFAVRQQAYRPLSLVKMLQSTISSMTQLGLGFFSLGAAGLVVGDFFGRITGSVTLFRVLGLGTHHLRTISKKSLWKNAIRYRRFPFFFAPYLLTNQAGLYLPTLLLSTICGLDAGGAFFMAQRVVQLPLALVGRSVARVFLGKAAELSRTKKEKVHLLTRKTFVTLFKVAVVPSIGIAIFGKILLSLVLGEQWAQAGEYAQLLAIPLLLHFSIAPIMQVLSVIKREDYLLAWGGFRLLAIFSGLGLPASVGLSSRACVVGFAVATVLIYFVGGVIVHYATRKYHYLSSESISTQ